MGDARATIATAQQQRNKHASTPPAQGTSTQHGRALDRPTLAHRAGDRGRMWAKYRYQIVT